MESSFTKFYFIRDKITVIHHHHKLEINPQNSFKAKGFGVLLISVGLLLKCDFANDGYIFALTRPVFTDDVILIKLNIESKYVPDI